MTTTAEVFTAALQGAPCTVTGLGPSEIALPLHHWNGAASRSDLAVLEHCAGATLDVGCGPGRMTDALARSGRPALGIDILAEAVALTRAKGASAVCRDVFDRLPGEGRWDCVLLADGNIGIGGDPVILLRRVAQLLHDEGRLVADLASPGVGAVIKTLRIHAAGGLSDPFDWAVVAPEAITEVALTAGFEVVEVRRHRSRWFAVLEKG